MKAYKATLNSKNGRYTVQFTHPILKDKSNPNVGRRMHRGLRTGDIQEARRLLGELSVLLGNEMYWSESGKELAGMIMDDTTLNIFYSGVFDKSYCVRCGSVGDSECECGGVRVIESEWVRSSLMDLLESSDGSFRDRLELILKRL